MGCGLTLRLAWQGPWLGRAGLRGAGDWPGCRAAGAGTYIPRELALSPGLQAGRGRPRRGQAGAAWPARVLTRAFSVPVSLRTPTEPHIGATDFTATVPALSSGRLLSSS